MCKRIGIIGAGSVAQRFINGMNSYQGSLSTETAKFTAIADISPVNNLGAILQSVAYFELPRTWAERPNPKSVPAELTNFLNEVDAVYVATTNSTHRSYIVRAVQAGKHVLVTKPVTHTFADGEKLLEELNAVKPDLSCGKGQDFSKTSINVMYEDHYLYCGIMFDLLSKKIKSPFVGLGAIKRVDGFLNEAQGKDRVDPNRISWLLDPELSGGGLWIDLGVHLTICLRKLGADLKVTSALPQIEGGFRSEISMVVEGVLKTQEEPSDIEWDMTPFTMTVQKKSKQAKKKLVLNFEKGEVVIDFLNQVITRSKSVDDESVFHKNDVDPYSKLAEVFSQLIIGGDDNRLASVSDALEEMKLVKQVYRNCELTDENENWIAT